MGGNKNRAHSPGDAPSLERESSSDLPLRLVEDLIRAAVLGLGLGSVLFVVADQTTLIDRVLFWLDLPGVGEHLGPKHLVLVGILFGVALDLLDKLLGRTRRFLGDLFTRG
jgi:hypothetical protein